MHRRRPAHIMIAVEYRCVLYGMRPRLPWYAPDPKTNSRRIAHTCRYFDSKNSRGALSSNFRRLSISCIQDKHNADVGGSCQDSCHRKGNCEHYDRSASGQLLCGSVQTSIACNAMHSTPRILGRSCASRESALPALLPSTANRGTIW